MTPAAILAAVDQHGGRLTKKGDKLVMQASTPLPDDLRQAIRLHKAALLALLSPQREASADDGAQATAVCPRCGAGEPWAVQGNYQCMACPMVWRLADETPPEPIWRCRTCPAIVPISTMRWGVCPACRAATVGGETALTAEEHGDDCYRRNLSAEPADGPGPHHRPGDVAR